MIFGADGIINAHDSICFDEKCQELESFCEDKTRKFVSYFQKRLKKLLKHKVNEPVQKRLVSAGWTNNNSESINHVLKLSVDWKSRSLMSLIENLKILVTGQPKELRSALISTGEFRLADTHSHFQISKQEWTKLTDAQRNNRFKKFQSYVITDKKLTISTDRMTEVVAPKTHGKKPGQRKRKINARTNTITNKKQCNDELNTIPITENE